MSARGIGNALVAGRPSHAPHDFPGQMVYPGVNEQMPPPWVRAMSRLTCALLALATLPLLPGCIASSNPQGGIQSDIKASRDRPASSAIPGQRAAERVVR
jgi:hypothetical protein